MKSKKRSKSKGKGKGKGKGKKHDSKNLSEPWRKCFDAGAGGWKQCKGCPAKIHNNKDAEAHVTCTKCSVQHCQKKSCTDDMEIDQHDNKNLSGSWRKCFYARGGGWKQCKGCSAKIQKDKDAEAHVTCTKCSVQHCQEKSKTLFHKLAKKEKPEPPSKFFSQVKTGKWACESEHCEKTFNLAESHLENCPDCETQFPKWACKHCKNTFKNDVAAHSHLEKCPDCDTQFLKCNPKGECGGVLKCCEKSPVDWKDVPHSNEACRWYYHFEKLKGTKVSKIIQDKKTASDLKMTVQHMWCSPCRTFFKTEQGLQRHIMGHDHRRKSLMLQFEGRMSLPCVTLYPATTTTGPTGNTGTTGITGTADSPKHGHKPSFLRSLKQVLSKGGSKDLQPTDEQCKSLSEEQGLQSVLVNLKSSNSAWLEHMIDCDVVFPDEGPCRGMNFPELIDWKCHPLFSMFKQHGPDRIQDLRRRATCIARDVLHQGTKKIVSFDGHGRFVLFLLIALVSQLRTEQGTLHDAALHPWRSRLNEFKLVLVDMDQAVHDWQELFIPGEHCKMELAKKDQSTNDIFEEAKLLKSSLVYFNFCGLDHFNGKESRNLVDEEEMTFAASSFWVWLRKAFKSKQLNVKCFYMSFNCGNNANDKHFEQNKSSWEFVDGENMEQKKLSIFINKLHTAENMKIFETEVDSQIISYRSSYPFVTFRLAAKVTSGESE